MIVNYLSNRCLLSIVYLESIIKIIIKRWIFVKKAVAFTVVLSFILLVFTSCKSQGGEKVLRDFITEFYTVDQSDYDFYEKAIKGANESEVAEFDKAYETENKKFKPYLTDNSYVAFVNDRLSVARIKNFYAKGNLAEVKDIKISKSSENEKEKTITYNFELQLKEKNKDTKKEETTKKSGTITVINENDTYKIVDAIPINWTE